MKRKRQVSDITLLFLKLSLIHSPQKIDSSNSVPIADETLELELDMEPVSARGPLSDGVDNKLVHKTSSREVDDVHKFHEDGGHFVQHVCAEGTDGENMDWDEGLNDPSHYMRILIQCFETELSRQISSDYTSRSVEVSWTLNSVEASPAPCRLRNSVPTPSSISHTNSQIGKYIDVSNAGSPGIYPPFSNDGLPFQNDHPRFLQAARHPNTLSSPSSLSSLESPLGTFTNALKMDPFFPDNIYDHKNPWKSLGALLGLEPPDDFGMEDDSWGPLEDPRGAEFETQDFTRSVFSDNGSLIDSSALDVHPRPITPLVDVSHLLSIDIPMTPPMLPYSQAREAASDLVDSPNDANSIIFNHAELGDQPPLLTLGPSVKNCLYTPCPVADEAREDFDSLFDELDTSEDTHHSLIVSPRESCRSTTHLCSTEIDLPHIEDENDINVAPLCPFADPSANYITCSTFLDPASHSSSYAPAMQVDHSDTVEMDFAEEDEGSEFREVESAVFHGPCLFADDVEEPESDN